MIKSKTKKFAWWLKFNDGSIKKIFTPTMMDAWKRGQKMGNPLSISGSKAALNVIKKETSAADPQNLINLLEFIENPFLKYPNENMDYLIQEMRMSASQALQIVNNFPTVVIEP